MDSFDGQNLGRATIRGSHEARFDIERGDIDLFVIPRTEFCIIGQHVSSAWQNVKLGIRIY